MFALKKYIYLWYHGLLHKKYLHGVNVEVALVVVVVGDVAVVVVLLVVVVVVFLNIALMGGLLRLLNLEKNKNYYSFSLSLVHS